MVEKCRWGITDIHTYIYIYQMHSCQKYISNLKCVIGVRDNFLPFAWQMRVSRNNSRGVALYFSYCTQLDQWPFCIQPLPIQCLSSEQKSIRSILMCMNRRNTPFVELLERIGILFIIFIIYIHIYSIFDQRSNVNNSLMCIGSIRGQDS